MIKRKNVFFIIITVLIITILSLGCPEINLGLNTPSNGGSTPKTGTEEFFSTTNWTPDYDCTVVIVQIVGGGGASGSSQITSSAAPSYGEGGEAGQVRNNISLSGTFNGGSDYTVTVGTGGIGTTNTGGDGNPSSFEGVNANGGDGGRQYGMSFSGIGESNGSGYGSGADAPTTGPTGVVSGNNGQSGYVKIEWTQKI